MKVAQTGLDGAWCALRTMDETHCGLQYRDGFRWVYSEGYPNCRRCIEAMPPQAPMWGMPTSEYQYIHLVELTVTGRKTATYSVRNNKSDESLGLIQWYAQWRQYIFYPANDTIYSAGCLKDIETFITELMNARKVASLR